MVAGSSVVQGESAGRHLRAWPSGHRWSAWLTGFPEHDTFCTSQQSGPPAGLPHDIAQPRRADTRHGPALRSGQAETAGPRHSKPGLMQHSRLVTYSRTPEHYHAPWQIGESRTSVVSTTSRVSAADNKANEVREALQGKAVRAAEPGLRGTGAGRFGAGRAAAGPRAGTAFWTAGSTAFRATGCPKAPWRRCWSCATRCTTTARRSTSTRGSWTGSASGAATTGCA